MKIVYLISHSSYIPYFAVSLLTLRHFHDEPVVVYSYDEPFWFLSQLANDFDVVPWTPEHDDPLKGQFLERIKVVLSCDEPVLYLDADTMIQGELNELTEHDFTITQVNQNVGFRRSLRSRIRRIGRFFPELDSGLIRQAISKPLPVINGGVFYANSKRVLQDWLRWTSLAYQVVPVPDEVVLNVFQARDDVRVIFGHNGTVSFTGEKRVVHGVSNSFLLRNYQPWFDQLNLVKQNPLLSKFTDLWLERIRKVSDIKNIDRLIRRR